MKLYVWQPNGHGQYSFFVAAESEELARAAVDKMVAQKPNAYEYQGWGTEYYTLTVADAGEVVTNEND